MDTNPVVKNIAHLFKVDPEVVAEIDREADDFAEHTMRRGGGGYLPFFDTLTEQEKVIVHAMLSTTYTYGAIRAWKEAMQMRTNIQGQL